MSNIETHKCILVKLVNPASTFTQYINLPFIPDVLEVKNFSGLSTASITVSFRCNDLPIEHFNNQLFCVALPANSFQNIPFVNIFKITGPVNGNYTFNILNQADGLTNINGNLMVYLNFIKYKK